MPSREFEVYIKPMVDQNAVNKAKNKIKDGIGGEPVDIKLGTQEIQKQLKEISGAVKGIQGVMKSGFSVKGTKEVNDAFNSMINTIGKLDTKLEELFKDSKQAGSVVNVGDIKLAEGQLNILEQSLKDIQSTLTDISNKSKTAFQLKEAKAQAERDLKALNKALMSTYSENFDSGFKIDLNTTDFKRQAGDILQIGKKTSKEINEMFSGRRNPNSGMSAYYNNLVQTLSGHLASGGKLSDKINAFAFTDTNGSVKAVETTVGEVVNALRNMFRQVSNEGENLEATLDRIFNIPKSMSKVNSGVFKDLFNVADAREKLGVIESEFTEAEAREARFSKSTIKNFEAISKALKEFIVDSKGIDSLIQTFEKLNLVLEELKTTLTTTDFNAVAQAVGGSGGRNKGTNSLESISKQVAKINLEYKELAGLKKEMDAKGLDSSNTQAQLSSLLAQRKALTDEYIALSVKNGIDDSVAKRNLLLATQRIQAQNKLTQGVKEEAAALKERNKEEAESKKASERAQKSADKAQEKKDLSDIKNRMNEIKQIDKEIFELEQNIAKARRNGDSADQINALQQQVADKKYEQKLKSTSLRKYITRRGMNDEWDAFKSQRASDNTLRNQRATTKEQASLSKNRGQLRKEIEEVQQALDKIRSNNAFNLVKQDVESADNSVKELVNDLDRVSSETDLQGIGQRFDTLKTSVDGIKESLKEAKKYNDQFSALTEKMTKLQNRDGFTRSFKSTFDSKLSEINNLQKNATTVEELGKAYEEASTRLAKFEAETKDLNNLLADQTSIDKLNLKIEKFVQDNSKMGHKLSEQFSNLQIKLQGADITQQQVKDITSEFLRLEAQVYKFGKTGTSMFDNLRNRIKQMSTNFVAMYFSFYDIIRYIRQTVSAVTEIDSALTELRKVSDASQLRISQNFEVSAKAAQDLGSTIKDVINITADWSRLGYNMDEAEELARVTTMFKTVGDDMTAESASEAMISTLKAYDVEVDKAQFVLDQYNEVANNFAIDTAGLADSLTRSGAALHAAGNEISESMGLIVAANDSLQDPSSVGQMLKTMSMRLRGASVADLEELGIDTTGMSQGKKSVVQQFKAQAGIDIMEGTQYKTTFQILDELHDKWADLNDAERAAITEAVGGKRGGSVMSSLMTNWEDAKKVVETANEAEGSATREMEHYSESIDYSLQRVKASFEELAHDAVSSEFVKNFLEFGNSALQVLDEIIEDVDTLPVLLTAVGSALALFNLDKIVKNISSLVNTGKQLGTIQSAVGMATGANGIINATGASALLGSDLLRGMDTTQLLTKLKQSGGTTAMADEVLALRGVAEAEREAMKAATGFGQATKGAVGEGAKISGLKALWMGLADSIGVSTTALAGFVGAAAAIGLVIGAVVEAQKAMSAIRESSQEYADNYKNAKSEIESYKEEIISLQETIHDSNSTYEESKTARERLYEIQSALIENYGSEKDAIDLITHAIDGEVDALDRLSGKEWEKTIREFNESNIEGRIDSLATRGRTKVQTMLDEIEGTNRNGRTASIQSDLTDIDFMRRLAELYDGVVRFDYETNSAFLDLNGNAYDLVDTLYEIQALAKDSGLDKGFEQSVNQQLKNLEKATKSWKDFYDQYVMQEYIFKNSTLTDLYDEYSKGVDAYKKAFASGSEEEIGTATENVKNEFVEIKKAVKNSNLGDSAKESVLKAFDNLAPELQSKFGEIDFSDALSSNASLKELIKEVKKNFEFSEEITHFQENGATATQKDLYDRLNDVASHYNLTLEKMIELLMERNELESRADTDYADRTKRSFKELAKLGGMSEEDFDRQFRHYGNDDWIKAASEVDAYKQRFGLLTDEQRELNSLIEDRYSILKEMHELGLNGNETQFGNIDLGDPDRVIYWSKENIEKFKNALPDWVDNPNNPGTLSTALGARAGFGNEFGEFEIAFSPILKTPEGTQLLDANTVYDYISRIVASSQKVDGSDILELDAKGLDTEFGHIQGLIAGVGEAAEKADLGMHFSGAHGELALINEQIDKIKAKMEQVNEVPTFEEAKESVDEFLKGTDEVGAELENIKAVLADVQNVDQETYSSLIAHSQKYANALTIQNGRLTVNKQRLLAVANTRVKERQQTLKQVTAYKKLEYLKRYRELKMYDEKLVETTSDTYDQITALEKEVTELDLLCNSLEQATDAFDRFKEAQQTEDAPDYSTLQDAYKAVNEGLESGFVGTDDFKTAQQLLYSADAYKEFTEAASQGYEAQRQFVEEWQSKNARFFTEDDFQNVKNFHEALKETGLLDNGQMASSEEIGKYFGMSHDAVNGLIQKLNLVDFDGEVIKQSPVDFINNASQAISNLTNSREALNEAIKSGADANLLTSLEEDAQKAETNYNDFMASLPETFAKAKEKMGEGLSFAEALYGSEDGLTDVQSANALSFITTLGIGIDDLQNKLAKSKVDGTFFDPTLLNQLIPLYSTLAHGMYSEREAGMEDRVEKATKVQTDLLSAQKNFESLEFSRDNGLGATDAQVEEAKAQVEGLKASLSSLVDENYMIQLQLDASAVEAEISAVKNELDSLKETKVSMGGNTAAQEAVQGAINARKSQMETLEGQKADIERVVNFSVEGIGDVESANSTIESIEDKDVTVTANAVDNGVSDLKNKVDSLNDKNVTVTVTGVQKGNLSAQGYPSSFSPANGTAHATGTDWSLSKNENGSLVGELGPEGLVRDGKFYLIGKQGPERKNLKKGDIIFNHKQTEELLKNGYATERGTLIGTGLAEGTLIGTAHSLNQNNANLQEWTFRNGSSSTAKSIQKAAKETTDKIKDDIDETEKETEEATENFIDWIERKINYITTKTERYFKQAEGLLDRVTNTMYSGGKKGVNAFKIFNKTVDSFYSTITKNQKTLMNTQKDAYKAYTNLTNAVGLDPVYQERVKKGLMEIENVTDETLKDQISKYQDFYDKSQSALDAFIEAAQKLYHLPIDKAAEKIENYANKIEYLDKKLSNATNYRTRNAVLDEQDTQKRLTYEARQEASKKTEKTLAKITEDTKKAATKQTKQDLKDAKKDVKNKKQLAKLSKTAQKEVKTATKNNQAIDLKKLEDTGVKKSSKAYKKAKAYNEALANKKFTKDALNSKNALNLENFEEGTKAYNLVVKYNAAIESASEAWNDMKNAEEEYLHWHNVEYPKAKFDNIAKDYQHAVEMINHDFTDYDNQIGILSKASMKVSTGFYTAQLKLNEDKLKQYKEERVLLEKQISSIQKYSDEWYAAYKDIKDVDNAISQLTLSTMELNSAIRQLYLDSFQGMRDDLDTIISEQKFLQSLMAHNKKTNDEQGYFTTTGETNLTSDASILSLSKQKQNVTAQEIKELQDLLDKGQLKWHEQTFASTEELQNQIRELYNTWQSEIKDTYDAENFIVELMKERYQSELKMYQDIVSKKKESLSTEKELYEYQKKISEKTKNLAQLEKQLAAYMGDSSQEGMAKRQKLQKDINSAREDLRDTEYEKYISDQQEMLDSLMKEYEDRIEKKLEDFNGLLEEGIGIAKSQTEATKTIYTELANANGYIPLKLNDINATLAGTAEGTQMAFEKALSDVFGLKTDAGSMASSVGVMVTALTSADSPLLKTITDANAVLTSAVNNILLAVNGKSASENQSPTVAPSSPNTSSTPKQTTAPVMQAPVGVEDKNLTAFTGGVMQLIDTPKQIKAGAEKYIKEHAKTGRKPSNGSSFSDVNAQISKFMGTSKKKNLADHKVLSTAELKELAKLLGITYDNAKKTGNLYKKLHEYGIAGFAQGGLVEAIKKNGDDGIATLKVGEAILTPTDSKNLASLANKFEAIDVTGDIMNMLKESAKKSTGFGTPQNIDYGGVQFNFELPNVANPRDFVTAIQNDSGLQKAIQSVSVDRINNGGRLTVNRLK